MRKNIYYILNRRIPPFGEQSIIGRGKRTDFLAMYSALPEYQVCVQKPSGILEKQSPDHHGLIEHLLRCLGFEILHEKFTRIKSNVSLCPEKYLIYQFQARGNLQQVY